MIEQEPEWKSGRGGKPPLPAIDVESGAREASAGRKAPPKPRSESGTIARMVARRIGILSWRHRAESGSGDPLLDLCLEGHPETNGLALVNPVMRRSRISIADVLSGRTGRGSCIEILEQAYVDARNMVEAWVPRGDGWTTGAVFRAEENSELMVYGSSEALGDLGLPLLAVSAKGPHGAMCIVPIRVAVSLRKEE